MKKRRNRNEKIRYVNLVGQPEKRWYQTNKRKIETISFFCVLFVGMIVSLIIPLRPTFSETEKRELAKFPEFNVQALVKGTYFADIDTWFADTFPFRESLTTLNSKLTSWYGFGDKVSSLNGVVADEIPDAPNTTLPPLTTDKTETTAPNETTDPIENTTDKVSEPSSVAPESTTDAPKKTQTLGGILVVGNSGYEYYNFIQSTADEYARCVNSLNANLKGTKTKVYDIVVPTSIDITLDESTRNSVQSSNQQKAIDYIYASMDKKVKTVDIYTTLKQHSDEYIYYRTDHHWTALGAYYSYVELMKAKGDAPLNLEKNFTKTSYGDFLGSFYTDTNKNKKLEKKPDDLIAYVPKFKTDMFFLESDGDKITWPIVNDVSSYPTGYKYSAFAGGDNKYTRVKNLSEDAKGSCIVIKESFGNAMIPFIAGNYKYVYVIDYRYWNGSLSELAKEKKADDVIFINNISATRNKALVQSLSKLCY